jgi:aryl-alcohol dehydrogenase-like predicted oxidoreductase
MRKARLGTNGPELSVIGFGAWAIGGPWVYGWGPQDDGESIRAIHRAIDLGITWIDTAAAYGFGHSERVVGKALRGRRQQVTLATKCGLVDDGTGEAKRDSRPEGIRRELEASLRNLETDCIDLYQIHWHDENVPVEDAWGEMARLRDEGKVRCIGVSNYDVPLLERCSVIAPVQSLQPPYSILNRAVEEEILPYCLTRGIGVVAYSPMGSGLLTGRFDASRLAPDDWRRKFFAADYLRRAEALVERLRPVAQRHDATVGQLAVAWVLRHPAVTSAIVGARTGGQVEENLRGAELSLQPEDLAEIERAIRETA